MRSFADIPPEIRRRVDDGERVALILLDGLGRELLCHHDRHPFVRRLELTAIRSQFPSTTTAHVTTAHFGVAVEDHGLYEWHILEPSLARIVCPLRFDVADGETEGALADRLDPSVLAPGPTLYETLGVRSLVLQPGHISGSCYTAVATRGARRAGFDELTDGLKVLVEALSDPDGYGYGFLYWDRIDAAGHRHGPDSPEFRAEATAALDALELVLGPGGDPRASQLTVLVTADHGQVPVAPDRVDYVDDLWPQLPGLLEQPRPAGSSRDMFLHVVAGEVDNVIEGLSERLSDRAEVRPASELFERVGPRLRERLGDVVVLPAAGRQVWLRSASGPEQWFRGHHGGLHDHETATYLARLAG